MTSSPGTAADVSSVLVIERSTSAGGGPFTVVVTVDELLPRSGSLGPTGGAGGKTLAVFMIRVSSVVLSSTLTTNVKTAAVPATVLSVVAVSVPVSAPGRVESVRVQPAGSGSIETKVVFAGMGFENVTTPCPAPESLGPSLRSVMV